MKAADKLKSWMTANRMRTIDVSVKCGGVWPNHISRITAGKSVPSLKLAFMFEEMTGGEIPAKSWVVEPEGDREAA